MEVVMSTLQKAIKLTVQVGPGATAPFIPPTAMPLTPTQTKEQKCSVNNCAPLVAIASFHRKASSMALFASILGAQHAALFFPEK